MSNRKREVFLHRELSKVPGLTNHGFDKRFDEYCRSAVRVVSTFTRLDALRLMMQPNYGLPPEKVGNHGQGNKPRKGEKHRPIRVDSYRIGYYIAGWKQYEYCESPLDGLKWWAEYDEDGHPIRYEDSEGRKEESRYDRSGNEVYFKGPDGVEHYTEYNEDGREVYSRHGKWERWALDNPNRPADKDLEYKEPFTF